MLSRKTRRGCCSMRRWTIPSTDSTSHIWTGATGARHRGEPSVDTQSIRKQSKDNCLVVATNTRFSNPTRDWVKAWQVSHPKPKIKLWDHSQLERFLSRHPDVPDATALNQGRKEFDRHPEPLLGIWRSGAACHRLRASAFGPLAKSPGTEKWRQLRSPGIASDYWLN